MNTEIRAQVWVNDGKGVIPEVDGQPASWERTVAKDTYKHLLGDGQARVSLGLGEKIGGPYAYSSVDLRINITITCDQSAVAIAAAEQAAYSEAVAFLEDHVDSAMNMLNAHLRRVAPQE